MFRFFYVVIIAFVLMLNINVGFAHDCSSGTYAESVSELDPDIDGTDFTYDDSLGTWTTNFSYGDVSGISTCNSTSGSYGTAYPQYNFEQGTSGAQCWCKMTGPARSAWVYYGEYGSASDCAANCAYDCAVDVRDLVGFRACMFNSAYQCVANYTNDCTTGTHFLDPYTQGTNFTYDNSLGTWTTNFSYGDVSGISTCNSTSGSYGTAYPQYNFEQGTSGARCWCKMTEPARSAWVYRDEYGSASDCAVDCAGYCAYGLRYNHSFRGGVFGSADEHCIANTININWENATGGTHASNSCTYGGALSTPAIAPTKRGYVFTGWAFE